MKPTAWGILVLAILFPCHAFSGPLPEMKTSATEVIFFKNGTAYVTKQGSPPINSGWVVMDSIPEASYGSFFLKNGPGRVSQIISEIVDNQKQVDAETIAELLEANQGKSVTLVLSDGKEYKGEIKKLVKRQPADQPSASALLSPIPDEYARHPYSSSYSYSGSPANPQEPGSSTARLLIMNTDGGILAINSSLINRIILPKDAALKMNSSEKQARIRLLLSGRGSGPLEFGYLTRGLAWTPSYQVDISDKKTAKIQMAGIIISENENLENARVRMVTGYPNHKFAYIRSPLNPYVRISDLINLLLNPPAWREALGVLGQSTTLNLASARAYDENAALAGAALGERGEASEDLFFYDLPKVTLKKGGRLMTTLMNEKVPYRHIYEWEIEDTLNKSSEHNYYPAGDQKKEEKLAEIWHSLELNNTTAIPWTTAPVTIVSGSEVLGQDQLNYTPKQGKQSLKITRAFDIKADSRETEAKRARDAARIHNSSFDVATIDGRINLKNFKNEKIRVRITKELSGEVKQASNNPAITTIAEGIGYLNVKHKLVWELDVPAGKEVKLTYEYEALVK